MTAQTGTQNQAVTAPQTRITTQTKPQTAAPPRPEIQVMFDLISRMGFMMMGATGIIYDNENYRLGWQMGSGALCDAVGLTYDAGMDLYKLDFVTHDRDDYVSFEQVYTDNVRPLIEKHTGFYLKLF